jgi:hypothetical protein
MNMRKLTQRWWLVAGVLAVGPAAFAQQTPPAAPARQAPPPEDLEPGVNTSAMPANTAPTPPPPAPAAASTPAPKPAASSKSSAAASGSATAPAGGNTSAVGAAPKTGKAATPPAAGAKGSGKAEDHLQLDTTSITGNQELPKVLYIVPWKRSDLGDMLGKPANSLLDEVLQPVDRDVFRRQNRYYDALKPDAGGAAGKATGAAVQGSGDKR